MKQLLTLISLLIFVGGINGQKQNSDCELRHWYLDQDGDGHYLKDTIACESPAFGWNLTSNFGIDPEDDNAFFPYNQQFLGSIREVEFPNGDVFLYYRGKVYQKGRIWIKFLDRTFQLHQIVFDEDLPVSYFVDEILYTSKDIPFKQGSIQVGEAEELFFTYDTVQFTVYDFKPEFWKKKYDLIDLIPRHFCNPINRDPAQDLINDISGNENAGIRELILSDVRFLETWVCLYCEFYNLSKHAQVLKLLTPPTSERGSGIRLDRDPKEYLMEEVIKVEWGLRKQEGIAKGKGEKVKYKSMGNNLEYIPIPKELAKELDGKKFETFQDFEDKLWQMIKNDDRYPSNLRYWNYGIRYKIPLYKSLDPYDMDNMIICTNDYYLKELEPVSKWDFWE